MLDSAQNSLTKSTFASHTRKLAAIQKRPIYKVFSTICWFHELQLTIGASTAAAVRRKIEPTLKNGNKVVDQRWCDYRDGLHTPSAKVIALAEDHCPQSRHILENPLWDSIRLDRSPQNVAHELLGATCQQGDDLLTWSLRAPDRRSYDPRWLKKRCRAMIEDGSLEGLAVLTTCMRLAGKAGADRSALSFYRHATNNLLILGSWFYAHGIAQRIAEYYETVLFPESIQDPNLGTFSSSHYLHAVKGLNNAVLRAQAQTERTLTDKEVILIKLQILEL